jgi:hypothetical protein
MGLEFSVSSFAAAAWRYWRSPRQYVSGAGEPGSGYVVVPEPQAPTADGAAPQLGEREPLWDL